MSTQGLGATNESVAITAALLSQTIGATATILYNGAPITNASGYGFDTQKYDDCLLALNIGTVQGALGTIVNSVLESDTDDPSAATDLSGATFTDQTSSLGSRVLVGSIHCADTKRFLFHKVQTQGTPVTVTMSAEWIGGQSRTQAATLGTLEFDV